MPPLNGRSLRLLVLPDLTEVRLPPRSHKDLLQILDKGHLVGAWGIKVRQRPTKYGFYEAQQQNLIGLQGLKPT